jgi:hypothetical protein
MVLKVPKIEITLGENEQDTDDYEGDPEIEKQNISQ